MAKKRMTKAEYAALEAAYGAYPDYPEDLRHADENRLQAENDALKAENAALERKMKEKVFVNSDCVGEFEITDIREVQYGEEIAFEGTIYRHPITVTKWENERHWGLIPGQRWYPEAELMFTDILKLKARVERLEAALRFYADKESYWESPRRLKSKVEVDDGGRARRALESEEES